ncbi:Atxe2 family lasso peptide isopeptidase [Sphingomonas sp. ASV193]|uniref:Atxe2 family lasso peptide isopeptidase n=1 Tax=Sphingomonas sp. ASV193 TaxID=3144405 RepID=UPI0032E8761F
MARVWRSGVCLWAAPWLAAAGQGAVGATTVRDLVEQPAFSGLVVSPDGRKAAVRTETADVGRNLYHLRWLIVDPASGAVSFAGDGGAAIYTDPGLVAPGDALWAPDSSHFDYRALKGGAIGLWRSGARGCRARPLFVPRGNIERLLGVDRDGVTFITGPARADIVAAEQAEGREGIRIDRTVDLAQSLLRGGWVDGRLGAQRLVGRWFKRGGLLGSEPRERHRLDLATGHDRLLGREPVPPPATGPVQPPDGFTLKAADGAIATVSNGGERSVLRVTRAGGERVWMPAGIIAWAAWRSGGGLIIAVRDLHKRDRIFEWTANEERPRPIAGYDGTLSGGGYGADLPCAIARAYLLCIAAGPVNPPRLVSLSIKDGHWRTVVAPHSVEAASVPVVRRLEWHAGAATFTGVLLTPPGPARRYPLFLTYYRCAGWLKGGEGGEWPSAPLVESGIVVACINAARDHGPQDALAGYRTAEAGIRALIERLDAEGAIDPHRVGMGGFSFGSEVTMWMLTHTRLISAASITSPQIEPAYYWLNAGRGRDQPGLLKQVWGLGPPGTSSAQWAAASPVGSIDRIRAPLLLQMPEQEAREVPELLARLSRSAVASEAYAFPDEGHIKVEPAHQRQAMQRNLDWFRFWLTGATDLVDPGAARRWTALTSRGADPLPPG